MPRDAVTATPAYRKAIKRVRNRYSKRKWREAKVSVSKRQPQDALMSVASSLRAEFFSIANRLHVIRKHGERPFDRKLRGENMQSLRAANLHSAKVLP